MNTKVNGTSLIIFTMVNFGDWLLKQLQDRDMSQSELARLAGVSKGTISNLINGTKGAGQESLLAVARALKLPPELVFEKAGILPSNVEDPWVATMQHKISLLTGPRREMAERLLDTMLNEQDRETRQTKPARI